MPGRSLVRFLKSLSRSARKSSRRTGRFCPRLEALEDRSVPAVFPVTSLDDSGAGTLRQAILDANKAPGDDTITFKVTGTINLAGALPDLSSNLSFDGPGADLLTVRRDLGERYRIFTVPSGVTVSISGLTIANGSVLGEDGGGIWNAGTLTLDGCVLSGNTAERVSAPARGGLGGGIYNNGGTLTLSNCTVSGNAAVSFSINTSVSGGGIYNNTGTLTLSDCTVGGNVARLSTNPLSLSTVSGGGISNNTGTVSLSNCTVSGNSAVFSGFSSSDVNIRGGGFFNSGGSLSLTACTVSGNSGVGEGLTTGAAIYSTSGALTVNRCTFSSNAGGIVAVWYSAGTVTISDSTFTGNPAGQACLEGNGTLTVSNTTISGNGGYGIWSSGTATVSNSTISGNNGYGFRNNITLTVINSTISGNTAGGIENVAFSSDATATLRNVTVANNGGNQLWSGSGFGTPVATPTIQLRNVIVAGNGSQPNLFTIRGGTFSSQGHNLSSDNGSGFLTAAGDLTNLDPRLGPLRDNGGPTFTHALLPGSPALDAGDNTGAPEFDQRGDGFPRVVNDVIDIGAVEAQRPVPDPIPDQTVPAGQLVLAVPLAARDPDGDALTFRVEAVSLAYDLDQRLRLAAYVPAWDDWGGRGEKWLLDEDGGWHFLLPDGGLYLWDGGDQAAGDLEGTPGATYHADPEGLVEARPDRPFASLAIEGDLLTVEREPGTASGLLVTVIVSDGLLEGRTTFTITVSG